MVLSVGNIFSLFAIEVGSNYLFKLLSPFTLGQGILGSFLHLLLGGGSSSSFLHLLVDGDPHAPFSIYSETPFFIYSWVGILTLGQTRTSLLKYMFVFPSIDAY